MYTRTHAHIYVYILWPNIIIHRFHSTHKIVIHESIIVIVPKQGM